MSQLTRTQWEALYGTSGSVFPDNTTGEISEGDMRTFGKNLSDSYFNKSDDAYTGAKGQRAGVTAPTSLKDIETVSMPFTTLITFVDTTAGNVIRVYELCNETTAESSPTVIRPNDYATTTNEKVWRLRSSQTESEFARAFAEEIVFDKSEIDYAPHELTGDVQFTVSASGNLVNQFSSAIQTIITDGTHAVSFNGFQFIYGITNGGIPVAGTYQIFFLYRNGKATAHWAEPSSEEANLIDLSAPGSFAAVADGENEIDLSWSDVANESSYQIEKSSDGVTGWVVIASPASGSTSYSNTGLAAGETFFYRIKAIGDGETYSDSAYSTASATTEDAGDVTAPTFTFDPVNGSSTFPVNGQITITANEAIRNADGSEITDANVEDVITLKQTNSGGSDISFFAEINDDKTVILISPTTSYGTNQLVYLAIHDVEDVNGNEIGGPSSITFTTTEFSEFSSFMNNRLMFGDILDTLWTANDTNFWLEITLNNMALTGAQRFVTKIDPTNQRSFSFYSVDTDIYFAFYHVKDSSRFRAVKWAGALTSGEHEYVMKYDGSIDTNNGLDRCILEIDGVVAGSKTLSNAVGVLGDIDNATAQLCVGVDVNLAGTPVTSSYMNGEAKDFIVRSSNGSVVSIDVPILRLGTDTSGNSRNGTWV
jgi:hypothetical protein